MVRTALSVKASSILMLCLFFSILSFAQRKKDTLDKVTSPRYRITGCFKTQKFSEQERMTLYPFNEAVKVEVVTFSNGYYITESKFTADSIDYKCFSHIKELNKEEISELTDIIFNIEYTFEKLPKNVRLIDQPTCYDPHNAVILTDEKGKHFAFIEVCFGCRGWRIRNFRLGYNCDLRFSLFEKWFMKVAKN